MGLLNVFLSVAALMLGITGIVSLKSMITNTEDPKLVPVSYFIGLSFASVAIHSASRVFGSLSLSGLTGPPLLRDLMVSYTALFLFGALWQTYELSLVDKPDWMD